MNFFHLLSAKQETGSRLRVGLIGLGKFGAMFLSQVRITPGIHLLGVADWDLEKAKKAFQQTGWSRDAYHQGNAKKALGLGTTWLTEDADELISADGLEVVIEATGDPIAGVRHAYSCIGYGRHVIMANVEADVLAGLFLAKYAGSAGVVYSLAYGDQPAIICEQVDWARASGLEVVAAGKGTLYMPEYKSSTPETVWKYYGITRSRAEESGMNAKMFNSFLDGTKSAIEMAAVCNATGLTAPKSGLSFPPVSPNNLAHCLIPERAGGLISKEGMVEVVSARNRDGTDLPNDLRWGTFVTFKAPNEYVARCFSDYGLIVDSSGEYSAIWRPYHLIGLELGISVANVGLLNLPTGQPMVWNADVIAVAKRDLMAGESLDGEGGYTVLGRLVPKTISLLKKALPIGLARDVKLKTDIKTGQVITFKDVTSCKEADILQFRKEMETFEL